MRTTVNGKHQPRHLLFKLVLLRRLIRWQSNLSIRNLNCQKILRTNGRSESNKYWQTIARKYLKRKQGTRELSTTDYVGIYL